MCSGSVDEDPEAAAPVNVDATGAVVGAAAAKNEWHYVEISVYPDELVNPIPSDLTNPTRVKTYLATITVDGVLIDGSAAGADKNIRVPAAPVDKGMFFAGGRSAPAKCPRRDSW